MIRAKITLEFDEYGECRFHSIRPIMVSEMFSEQVGHYNRTTLQAPVFLFHQIHYSSSTFLRRVRSYVMENGHLFLATMADGSIIEFEPVTIPVAGIVYGEEIRTNNAEELQHVILSRLFGHYATANNLKATDEEVDKYVEHMRHQMAADPNLTAMNSLTREEASEVEVMRREMGRALISQWKLNRALYQQVWWPCYLSTART